MKIILKIILSAIALVGLCVAIIAHSFYGNAVCEDSVIELSHKLLREKEYVTLMDSLVMPKISHKGAFDYYADRLNLPSMSIKAGRYELRQGMSVIDVVRMFKLGAQSPLNVTFNNARGVNQLAGRLSEQLEADSVALLSALTSKELARELGYTTDEMLAIFVPNTYNLWWTITPEDLVRRMASEYDRFWTEGREAKRKAMKMSRVEVSILASIVMEEAAKVDEMPRIAGVYVNRLRQGIRLQADPTVKFALGDFALKRILYSHLKYDSPYNTYRHKGLPPGPIATASIAALDSVLSYEKHDYIYFCARPELDGYHNFAASYTQHKLNAKRYAEELNRLGVR